MMEQSFAVMATRYCCTCGQGEVSWHLLWESGNQPRSLEGASCRGDGRSGSLRVHLVLPLKFQQVTQL